MEISSYKNYEMIAHEAFIRRAAEIDMPFMLKGSYITRQYFPPGVERIPADLDWVYMNRLDDQNKAEIFFSDWVIAITELDLRDGVKFTSFKKNRFWRMIDYAMAEDFPTVNTDIECIINEEQVEFALDISFNLDFAERPVPLVYKPMHGEPFDLHNTVPISLQVSWKIHQMLVRPRFKDLFDLIYLLQHPSFDEQAQNASFRALVNECEAGFVDNEKIGHFFYHEFEDLFAQNTINDSWGYWRHNLNPEDKNWTKGYHTQGRAAHITNVDQLPPELSDFLVLLKKSLDIAGFNAALLKKLPASLMPPPYSVKDVTPKPPPKAAESAEDKEPETLSFWKRLFKIKSK